MNIVNAWNSGQNLWKVHTGANSNCTKNFMERDLQ